MGTTKSGLCTAERKTDNERLLPNTNQTNTSNSSVKHTPLFNKPSKAKKPQISNMKKVDFKLHIAVDFGTAGCALAFAYKDKVTIYNKWRAQQTNLSARATRTTKTKTQLILNENNEVTCFGNAAKFTYFNLSSKEQSRKKFFEGFKMALYETHLARSNDIFEADEKTDREDVNCNTAQYLYDSKGKRIESKIVFIAAFQYLQQMARDYIPEKITNQHIKDEEIQWIVTVPAIWSEKAKSKMRDWMQEATLIDKHIIDQCMIVYEPDCASLSMQKQYFKDLAKATRRHSSQPAIIFNPCDDDIDSEEDEKNFKSAKKKINFEKNDKYILIDAGGGTVDIACHKILENGCVEEVVYPTGNKWGSQYIDKLYIKLLKTIFTNQWIVDYQYKEPAGFVEVLANFQKAKETFYKDSRAKTHRIRLPDDFVRFLAQECETQKIKLAEKINRFGESKQLKYFRELFSDDDEKKDDKKFDDEDDESVCSLKFVREKMNDDGDEDSDSEDVDEQWIEYIECDVKIWKCLFDSKINPIITHVEGLLEVEAMKDCQFLGLVGGFSSSKYFQSRIQKRFGEYGFYQMTVVTPKKPLLAVVQGAALMALTDYTYIQARKLKYTYGIEVYMGKEEAKAKGISDNYINNKKNISKNGQVKNCFAIVASKNERILMGKVKTTVGYRRGKTSKIPVLKSSEMNPKFASEAKVLATLLVPHIDSKREVITEFHFYGTIFEVYSYAKSNPNAKSKVDLKYDYVNNNQ